MCSYGTVSHQPFISVNGILKAAFYDIIVVHSWLFTCPSRASGIRLNTGHVTSLLARSHGILFLHTSSFFKVRTLFFFSIVNFVRTTVVGWNSQSDLLATDQSQLFCLFFYLKHIKRAGFHGKRIIALRITFRAR